MAGYRSPGINVGRIQQLDPSDNLDAASKLFGNIGKRIQGRATSKLLGEFSPGEGESIVSSQQRLIGQLANNGLSPAETLGLSNSVMRPYADQRDYDRNVLTSDRSYNLQASSAGERVRHNRAMENKGRAEPTDIRMMRKLGIPITAEGFTKYKSLDDNGLTDPTDIRMMNKLGFENTPEGYADYKSASRKDETAKTATPANKTTQANTRSNISKRMDDSAYKVLGEDGYEAYTKLPPAVQEIVLKDYTNTGILGIRFVEGSMFGEDDHFLLPNGTKLGLDGKPKG